MLAVHESTCILVSVSNFSSEEVKHQFLRLLFLFLELQSHFNNDFLISDYCTRTAFCGQQFPHLLNSACFEVP